MSSDKVKINALKAQEYQRITHKINSGVRSAKKMNLSELKECTGACLALNKKYKRAAMKAVYYSQKGGDGENIEEIKRMIGDLGNIVDKYNTTNQLQAIEDFINSKLKIADLINTTKAELAKASKELEEAKSALASAVAENKALTASGEGKNAEVAKQIEQLNLEKAALAKDVSSLQEQLKELEALKTSTAEKDKKIIDLEGKLLALEEEKKKGDISSSRFDEEKKKLEEKIAELGKQNSDNLDSIKKILVQNIASSETKMENYNKNLSRLVELAKDKAEPASPKSGGIVKAAVAAIEGGQQKGGNKKRSTK